ncbi:MAG TPA: RNA 2',3'-cyclic phosphodiesterase [Gammaproteobacteria bacterium]|jgi:2'-5' RNA ligase|nr:RNA 2',3'-cyclic phosphodiesterase [Gammaproteobacteria bacterium]
MGDLHNKVGGAGGASRLFFALWPEDPVRQALYKASRVAVQASDGKPVSASHFHITLAFLGSLDQEASVRARSAAASVRSEPFQMELDSLGHWPEPQVLWCGIRRVPAAARALAEGLRQRLVSAGLRPDHKPFVPHVTLARKARRADALDSFGPVAWAAKDFVLVSSVTGDSGSEYSPLATYALGAGGIVK